MCRLLRTYLTYTKNVAIISELVLELHLSTINIFEKTKNKNWLNIYQHNFCMNTFALNAVGSTLFDKGNMFRLHSYFP